MKKRKLFFLLTAIACLAMPLGACEDEQASQQETQTYELTKYLAAEDEQKSYSKVSKIDGEVESYDYEHNLAVVRTKELESDNVVKERVKVYDLVSGETVYEDYVSNSLSEAYPHKALTVTLEYPIICVTEETTTYSTTSGYDYDYEYSYYRAKKNSGSLKSYLDEPAGSVQKSGNLYSIEIDGTLYWLNEDAEIVRKMDETVASTYDIEFDFFKGAYNDYLYAWEFGEMYRRIQVFNTEGVCCAQYAFANNAVPMSSLFGGEVAYILNNGNVFTQEVLLLEADATEYDFTMLGNKYDVSSKIIDYKTGAVKEVDLNFLVVNFESAHTPAYTSEGDDAFAFALAEGKQNQARIMHFANGGLAQEGKYVVLDNELNVEYAFKNVDKVVEVNEATADYYKADAVVGNQEVERLYDYDGNVICTLPYNIKALAGNLILTDTAIYDMQMNLVYDLETSKFASNYGEDLTWFVDDGRIYLTVDNYLTGATEEAYVFDAATKDFTAVADGLDTELQTSLPDGLYGVRDNEKGTVSVYNAEGTLLLKMTTDYVDVEVCEDVAFVTTTVDGNAVCYVIQ